MKESENPKVTVNEDYVDLRNYNVDAPKKTSIRKKKSPRKKSKSPLRTFRIKNEGPRSEKELINCGLRNLVTSFNVNAGMYQNQATPRNKSCLSENSKVDYRSRRASLGVHDECLSLKSKSDLSVSNKKISVEHVCSSTPVFRSKKTNVVSGERVEPHKHKCTMTNKDDVENAKIVLPRKQRTRVRSRSKDFHITDSTQCVVDTPYENGRQSKEHLNMSVDPRLKEKYSILKMPCWKRSWTIPVFSRKGSMQNYNSTDNFDAQTYLYDEGSELDSLFVKKKSFFSKVFPVECLIVLSVMGAACGILLASLLIYIIYGNNVLQVFFKPREVPESSVKSYIKFIGGGLIYIITKLFRTLGDILSIPVQQKYEPQDPFRWKTDTW
ncbi:uncharacterized protein LOC130902139 isoform X2 [Diorhabda carinulata]|uniref:uncharacterized protein LOC130902139 isoform X2 n=1 Tax=Diorhabda carinulata TaxID=1163345 RepID=UPI0025A1706F|nr:uncharacterized protein LOC130902139 isoform X2 [Diorhabda carinulata]